MTTNDTLHSIMLDTDFLESIYDGDTEHACIIFEQFLSTSTAQLADINCSYEAGDVAEFRRKMHKIKPVFSFVGATPLTKKAETIEKKCLEITAVENISNLYTAFLREVEIYLPLVKNEYTKLRAA